MPPRPLSLRLRIFSVLGFPTTHQWPDMVHLQHWMDNTDNVRTRKSHHPEESRVSLNKRPLPFFTTEVDHSDFQTRRPSITSSSMNG